MRALAGMLDRLFTRLLGGELFRRIARNSGYLFSTTSLAAGMAMLQGILIARLLGVEGYGILGAVILFTSLVNKFTSFRMSDLVVKYVGQFSEHNDPQRAAAIFKAALLTEIVASCVAFGLVCLLAPFGAQYLAKNPALANAFMLYGVIILVNLVAESSTGLLQIFDRFRWIAGLTLVQGVLSLVLVVLVYSASGDMRQIILAYIAGKLVFGLGVSITAMREAGRRWGKEWTRIPLAILKPYYGELARFAIHTNISATINLINKDSELFWVSLFRPPAETGWYKLALTLVNIVELPITPLPQTTYPELSRQVAQKNWATMRQVLQRGSLLAGAYSVAAVAFLIVTGQWLISFIYKPEFLPAFPALVILLAGGMVSNMVYWRRVALLALGRADFPAKLNLVLAAFKLVGTLLLVPRFGYLASAALLSGFYWAGSLAAALKTRSILASQSPRPASLENSSLPR